MKTINQINDEIFSIQKTYENRNEFKKSELKRAGKKVRLLTECKYYLETNPRDEFILKSRNELKTKIKVINERFTYWVKGREGKTIKQFQKEWETLNKIPDLKYQLVVLNYLINEHEKRN